MPDQPNVATHHPDYDDALPVWEKIEDCLGGSRRMKDHDLNEALDDDARYILQPNPDDESVENWERYEQYVRRAVWYPATARTLRGMVGQAFLKPPTLTIPAPLKLMETNVDGTGTTLLQQARMALRANCSFGRCGLLTDYPPTKAPASRAQVVAGLVRPTIGIYGPKSIINWRTTMIGAERVLSLVVLVETAAVTDDGFGQTTETRYRELRLENGIYMVRVWREAKGDKKSRQPYELVGPALQPKDSAGRLWDRIPFQPIGSDSNDIEIDEAQLLDLVEMNIAHFRNSADYEESCYMCGQATPWSNGLTEHWLNKVLKGKMRLGSRGGLPLPVGAQVGLLQAAPNGMVKEAMDAKERQMVALGAKLIQPAQVQRTATEARLEYAGEVSALGTNANNVAAAYVQALAWAARFAGTKEASVFEIDADAEMRKMSPEELRELTLTWQSKGVTTSEYRGALRRGGIATLEDEEYKAELDSEPDRGSGAQGTGLMFGNQRPGNVPPEEQGGGQ